MKIALLGYGKMGKLIESLTDEVVATFGRDQPTPADLAAVDVCIDFSHPDSVIQHLKTVIEAGKDLVIGTTGWEVAPAWRLIEQSNIGVIYSPNFSIGIHLFSKLVAELAPKAKACGYHVAGYEVHHQGKVDAPSGTAKMLGEGLCDFMSVRCGDVPGTHTLLFDSPCDTIELTHRARSREGFAQGALQAARWIHGRKGLYTLDDLLKERS